MKIEEFRRTIQWYDDNALAYAEATGRISHPEQREKFLALLPSGAKVLDAGCGGGKDCRFFNGRGVHVIGLDISKGLLEEARKRSPDIEFKEGDMLKLPVEDGSFDGIWARASLIHLPIAADVEEALGEFNRVLKPEGIVFVLVKAQTGQEKTGIVSGRFYQYFNTDEIQKLATESGFEIIELNQYEGKEREEWILILGRKK